MYRIFKSTSSIKTYNIFIDFPLVVSIYKENFICPDGDFSIHPNSIEFEFFKALKHVNRNTVAVILDSSQNKLSTAYSTVLLWVPMTTVDNVNRDTQFLERCCCWIIFQWYKHHKLKEWYLETWTNKSKMIWPDRQASEVLSFGWNVALKDALWSFAVKKVTLSDWLSDWLSDFVNSALFIFMCTSMPLRPS